MVNLKSRLESLESSILELSKKPVAIVAVTKRFSAELYGQCSEVGIVHYGENRAQEVRDKASSLPTNAILHYLAPIQKNKVKYLKGKIHSFDALDSIETAQLLNQEEVPIHQKLNVLIQVNPLKPNNKSGVNLDETDKIYSLVDYCLTSKYLNLEGLMCMGPTPTEGYTAGTVDYDEDTRSAFAKTADFFNKLQSKFGITLQRLSMGMSDDYRVAVKEGSTEIRVGSLLFGPRPKG